MGRDTGKSVAGGIECSVEDLVVYVIVFVFNGCIKQNASKLIEDRLRVDQFNHNAASAAGPFTGVGGQ